MKKLVEGGGEERDVKNLKFWTKKIVRGHYQIFKVYIIMVHQEQGGAGLPCCLALLPDKSQDTYKLMLNVILHNFGTEVRKYYNIVT